MLHDVPLELFWFLELESEVQKQQGWNDTQAQRDSPDSAQMIFGADDHEKIWDECANDETPVNHDICEQNEPSVSRSSLQVTSGLGAGNRPSRILSSNPNTHEETVGGQGSEHALYVAPRSICSSTESCEDKEDDGGDE